MQESKPQGSSTQPDAIMIDTSKPQGRAQGSSKCNFHLEQLQRECKDSTLLRGVVDTLFKILTNIAASPMEPKFRRLGKQSKAVKEKILAYSAATQFLLASGFVEEADAFMLSSFD